MDSADAAGEPRENAPFWPSLPAARTVVTPASVRLSAAALSGLWGLLRLAPGDMLTTFAPSLRARSIPARMFEVVPPP